MEETNKHIWYCFPCFLQQRKNVELVAQNSNHPPLIAAMSFIYTNLNFIFFLIFTPQYAMFLTLIFLVELVAAIVGFVFRHEVSPT